MSGEFKRYGRKIEKIMGIVLLVFVTVIALRMSKIIEPEEKNIPSQENNQEEGRKKNGKSIVVDVGHGGKDPGKVGYSGTLEKDVNLAIGKKLKSLLESKGYEVVLTREEDEHLGEGKFRKISDLNERCKIINESFKNNENTVMVSIHQNSFVKEQVKGAQCFYYHQSDSGKVLAEEIQKKLNERINTEKSKNIKRNDNYYMLINSDCPGVIIECGFLSNPEEERKLADEEYQGVLAETIVQGINEYFGLE